MKRKRRFYYGAKFFLVAGIILILVFLGWLLALDLSKVKPEPKHSFTFPTMKIYLNEVALDELKVSKKSIKYEDNYLETIFDGGWELFSDVEIKVRGNSTWGLPKSPYQIKLKRKTDFLGLGAAKKWILLANYIDDSNLRNDVAYKLAGMLGEKYAVRGEFVRLFIDDSYEGLYYMTNKIEIAKASVDLRDPYGVLMEIDNLHRGTEDCIDTNKKVCLVLKDAVTKDDEIMAMATEQFLDDYNEFEQAVRAKDYDKITELVDVRSFAEYFLINEFAANPDAYCSSFFLYKDGEKDRIHAGPVWDFDYAFANQQWIWHTDEKIFSPREAMALRENVMSKEGEEELGAAMLDIYYMMEMPEFRDEVRKVFQEKLSGRAKELIDFIEARADWIEDEARIDARRWGFEDFDAEKEYLINWVRERYEFFEEEYGESL